MFRLFKSWFPQSLKLSNERGYSLVETMLVVGATVGLTAGIAAFNNFVITEESVIRAKFESNELKAFLRGSLVTRSHGAETCYDRLRLDGTEEFIPTRPFELSTQALAPESQMVRTDRLFLDQARLVRTSGDISVYSVLLKVEQSLKAIGNEQRLPTSVLGALVVSVDTNRNIVGCNWDELNEDASRTCSSIGGMYNSGIARVNCNFQMEVQPEPSVCPRRTRRDNVTGRCLPADLPCADRKIANAVASDGNDLGCLTIPETHTVSYPQAYYPPPQDVPRHETPPTPVPTATPQNTNPNNPPSQPPPANAGCRCGNSLMEVGGPALCVRAYSISDGIFGAADDFFDVAVCNSVGNLEAQQGYFEEEGDGVFWTNRIAQCHSYGGFKNVNGKSYKKGRCY